MSPKPDLRGIELRRRRRADGSVRMTYRVRAVAVDGSRPGKTFTDVEAAIEERDRLDVIAARIAAGPPARASMTVTGLRDRWWNGHVLRELAPRTQNGYRHAWGELQPRIGDRLAISVARRDIKQLRIDMLDDGLGPGSVNYKLTMLHAIFQHALEDDLVEFNPVAGVRKSKRVKRGILPRQIPSAMRVEQARVHVMREMASPMTATIISLGVHCGHRPSEWRALRWFDWTGDAITSAAVAEPDGTLRIGSKTNSAGVTRSMPPASIEDLTAWRAVTPYPADGDPIFPRADGTHWNEEDYKNWAGRKLTPCFAAVGCVLTPYGLRHTAISLLIQEGRLSLTQIAERHGTSVEMISRHYAHIVAAYAKGKIDLEAEFRKARRATRSGGGLRAMAT